ncbi:MAG: sugar phosphate nucleotidyltransferase, partial [Candidatus Dormibacteraeota bacterium]|nr:sugar phosphate nucleotidyltransferase [Candidatus Dormibacteraeota bacterium]
PGADLIVEPTARGTVNALGLAAMEVFAAEPDAVMICVPADHVIEGDEEYRGCIRRAIAAAQDGSRLLTIGLTPTEPATGFGYIHAGKVAGDVLEVLEFVEKPSVEVAQRYLAAGGYYWNLAMFCWRASTFLQELRSVAPGHHDGLLAVREGRADYADLPNQTVDYAVMEKTERLFLIPATFGWRDVGSWAELAGLRSRDEAGNSVDGDAALIDTAGSLISAPGKLVAAIGVQDLVVVDTEDALLIVPKSRVQDVKQLVELLRASGRTKYL